MNEKLKNNIFYVVMILLFSSLIYLVIQQGENRQVIDESSIIKDAPNTLSEGFHSFKQIITEQIISPFSLLLLQIIVILIMCKMVGWLMKKIGQPVVIGEILAGIILGPSILGYFAPEITLRLFPEESLSNITTLSQFGLILFMYTIGMELDMGIVKKKLQETLLISHISMIVPFFLGILVAYYIYNNYAYSDTPFISFALFIGIAMCITAFPVLARIIQERKLTRTHLGSIALASAANGDITAWCLLAVVVAISQAGNMYSAIYNILFSAIYVLIMFLVVRPLLKMLGNLYHNKEVIGKALVSTMFLLLLASSYVTEILGLHALFGAFIVGLVMPNNQRFRKIMTEKVEDVALALFLPLFFASTGLRTEIGLLNSNEMWILCGVFILVAIVGKFGGTIISARFAKESWKDSFILGAMMNTRGLMELVILSIGYELHILPPAIFVMLVLMTLVTTFMTTPLLAVIDWAFRKAEKTKIHRVEQTKKDVFEVLLSFGRAGNGQIMLDVAHQMFSQREERLDITALHLTVGSDVNPSQTENFERISFSPILYEAKKLNLDIKTRYEIAQDAGRTIVNMVNEEAFDFLLVGAGISLSNLASDVDAQNIHKSFFRFFDRFKNQKLLFSAGSLVKDKTKIFIEQSRCSVGVFVNRGFTHADNIIVIINSSDDLFLLDYTRSLVRATQGTVSLLNRISYISEESERVVRTLNNFVKEIPGTILLPEKDLLNESFNGQDFMLVSYTSWNIISEEANEPLQDMPSTLIINHKS
ncbi:MAG: cation:proton antiporter [Tannerella sp.]|jgi:Kef-type K+ transport system membrane component KefB|nr:cation:proton antiporter [Tannerella sp.]